MKFKINPLLYFFIFVFISVGVFLVTIILFNFSNKSENQKAVSFFFLLGMSIFYYVLYISLSEQKTIEIKDNQWIVRYLFKRKTIQLQKRDIQKITFTKVDSSSTRRLIGMYVPSHSEMSIYFKNKESINVNSLEIKDFYKMKKMLEEDFKGLIKNYK